MYNTYVDRVRVGCSTFVCIQGYTYEIGAWIFWDSKFKRRMHQEGETMTEFRIRRKLDGSGVMGTDYHHHLFQPLSHFGVDDLLCPFRFFFFALSARLTSASTWSDADVCPSVCALIHHWNGIWKEATCGWEDIDWIGKISSSGLLWKNTQRGHSSSCRLFRREPP